MAPALRRLREARAEGTRDDWLQLLPLDAGLTAVIELAEQPVVHGMQPGIVLRHGQTQVLVQYKDQTRQPAVLRKRHLQRPSQQRRYVEGRVHPPELVYPVGTPASAGAICLAAVKQVLRLKL